MNTISGRKTINKVKLKENNQTKRLHMEISLNQIHKTNTNDELNIEMDNFQ